MSFCPLGSPCQSKFSKWKEATCALFYCLQLFLQLNFQCGTLLKTASLYHTEKLRDYLTRLKTCYSPDTDKRLLETGVWFHLLQFTRYLPCPQAQTASGKNFRNLGKRLCLSHYNHIPSRELGCSPTTALLLNSYGTTALEVIL